MCRGHKDHRKFCCCSLQTGAHTTGVISFGLFIAYMVLLVRSSKNDNFNWQILLWCFAIGLVRVGFWIFLVAKPCAFGRRLYAFALIGSTALEFLLFIINQFQIFEDDAGTCDRVYSMKYMVTQWDIYCDWAIFL